MLSLLFVISLMLSRTSKKVVINSYCYRQYPESSRHNQTFDLQPKTYCFAIEIRLLFLVSIARSTGMNMSVERQRIAN